LRWEYPPEGAKSLQGYIIETLELIPPIGFARFDKKLRDGHWGEMECHTAFQNREQE
jgi:hypothetical protein